MVFLFFFWPIFRSLRKYSYENLVTGEYQYEKPEEDEEEEEENGKEEEEAGEVQEVEKVKTGDRPPHGQKRRLKDRNGKKSREGNSVVSF